MSSAFKRFRYICLAMLCSAFLAANHSTRSTKIVNTNMPSKINQNASLSSCENCNLKILGCLWPWSPSKDDSGTCADSASDVLDFGGFMCLTIGIGDTGIV